MTNAIEVTKREMCQWLLYLKNSGAGAQFAYASQKLEDSLEAHLEALRQEIEGLRGDVKRDEQETEKHQVALNIAGDELRRAQSLNRSYARQLAGTEESPAVMTILGALVDAQRIMADWIHPDGIRARRAMEKMTGALDSEALALAMREFEEPKTGE